MKWFASPLDGAFVGLTSALQRAGYPARHHVSVQSMVSIIVVSSLCLCFIVQMDHQRETRATLVAVQFCPAPSRFAGEAKNIAIDAHAKSVSFIRAQQLHEQPRVALCASHVDCGSGNVNCP